MYPKSGLRNSEYCINVSYFIIIIPFISPLVSIELIKLPFHPPSNLSKIFNFYSSNNYLCLCDIVL